MRIVRILLVVLLLFCGLFFGALIRSRSWGKHFAAVKPGNDRMSVLRRTGAPDRTMPCSALPEVPNSCQTVLVYAGPFSAVMPEYWLIPLNANGQVLRVLHTTRAD